MPSQESQVVNSEHEVPQISRRKALGITGSTAAPAGLGISLARPAAALAGTTDDGYFNVTEAPYNVQRVTDPPTTQKPCGKP